MEQFTDNATRLHYDLKAQIDPLAQYLSVTGSIVYHAQQPRQEFARFFLHHDFEVQALAGRGVLGYHYDKMPAQGTPAFLPEAGILDVYFEPPLSAGETALIQIHYDGYIRDWPEGGTSRLTPDWIELGSDLPWYPLAYDGGHSNLTFSLQATLPTGMNLASFGPTELHGGTWFINWGHATSDIVVAASPHLRSALFASESNQVRLHSVNIPDETAHLLGEDLLWIMERMAGWFGPVRPTEVTLIESGRPGGDGYARRGLILLGSMTGREYAEQRQAYLHHLAHEAAHAWWWKAPNNWENWLNESFAEYSALMAIRERHGSAAFEDLLARKRERASGAAPIWAQDPAGPAAPVDQAAHDAQVYCLGPLLLDQLAEKIGNRRFLDLCRGMQWADVQSTAHFLDLLEELEGRPVSDWMAGALKGQ